MNIFKGLAMRLGLGMSEDDLNAVTAYAMTRAIHGRPGDHQALVDAATEAIAAAGATLGMQIPEAQDKLREVGEAASLALAGRTPSLESLAPDTARFVIRFPRGSAGRQAVDMALETVLGAE